MRSERVDFGTPYCCAARTSETPSSVIASIASAISSPLYVEDVIFGTVGALLVMAMSMAVVASYRDHIPKSLTNDRDVVTSITPFPKLQFTPVKTPKNYDLNNTARSAINRTWRMQSIIEVGVLCMAARNS
jgi:hypothetical protein